MIITVTPPKFPMSPAYSLLSEVSPSPPCSPLITLTTPTPTPPSSPVTSYTLLSEASPSPPRPPLITHTTPTSPSCYEASPSPPTTTTHINLSPTLSTPPSTHPRRRRLRRPPRLRNSTYCGLRRQRSCTVKTSHVVNLSCKTLPSTTINLLSKGLGYAPTPEAPDLSKLWGDLNSFERSLRITHFFRNDHHPPTPKHAFKPKSTWNPPRASNPKLEEYITDVTAGKISETPPIEEGTTCTTTARTSP